MATTDPRDEDGEALGRWRSHVGGITAGKVVGGARYVHLSAVPDETLAYLRAEVAAVGGPAEGFNVLKLAPDARRLSLLSYPDFFERPFPLLSDAWTIDLAERRCEHRTYDLARNPPVLHRKELLLPTDDPHRAAFAALTAAAEGHGLFANPLVIGHRRQWEEIVRAKGLRVEGHSLVPLETVESAEVLRHRTAMARRALSTPMQALWRHGYLGAALSVFDYGCGRGDDLAALAASGVTADGWDPYYRPDAPRAEADVVNLGFVLNVIEDPDERREALTRAYGLARKVLAVSAILGGRAASEQHRAFGDGVLTSRSTFQKYFGHEELGDYVAAALGREPVSVGPGLFFVFRRDEDEQDFLEERQRSSGRFGAMPVRPAVERPAREPRAPRVAKPKAPTRWERHAELVEEFWRACVAIGRAPREEEFARMGELTRDVASAAVVLRRLTEERGAEELEQARVRRVGDLSVFFALNLFERRRSAGALGARAARDVREFWGSQAKAAEAGQRLLFSLRDARAVEAACEAAAAQGIGALVAGESLQVDARLVNELPPALRVYVGCAGKLYGEAQNADVVKLHIGSGKVSLMRYDDYEGSAVPLMVERVKIDLRRQQVSYYAYGGEYEPQPLWMKSRYMHAAMEGYAGQRGFDEALRVAAGEGVDWSGYGPGLEAMRGVLAGMTAPAGMRVVA